MDDLLQALSDADLRALTAALESGRVGPPYSPVTVGRWVTESVAGAVSRRLEHLAGTGMQPAHLATLTTAILSARATRPCTDDEVELVWTGPEAGGVTNRDTGVVVRELFAGATESVLVAGYAVYQGREVFRSLAERMVARPALRVRLFLDVHSGLPGEPAHDTLAKFAHKFVGYDWPSGFHLPEVYYDPRSLLSASSARACLHAKCVVVDRRVALVGSANFTEAAQERNIEVGVIVRSIRFAARLSDHFTALAEAGMLLPLPL